jgi:hypothetical protein
MELMDIAWFYHDYIIHDLEIIDLHENQEEIFFWMHSMVTVIHQEWWESDNLGVGEQNHHAKIDWDADIHPTYPLVNIQKVWKNTIFDG